MDNILNLKTYNKYLNLINEGLVLLLDNTLSNLIDDVHKAYRDKPLMVQGETHDVTTNNPFFMIKSSKRYKYEIRKYTIGKC